MEPLSSCKSTEPSKLIFVRGLLTRRPTSPQGIEYDPISSQEASRLLNVSDVIETTIHPETNNPLFVIFYHLFRTLLPPTISLCRELRLCRKATEAIRAS